MRNVKMLTLAVLLAALPLLAGCFTLSIEPLYTADDLVAVDEFNPGLVGVWGDPDNPDEEPWQFIATGSKSYRLIIREKASDLPVDPSRDGIFEVHVVRLGEYLILDLFPEEPESVSELYKAHVIPAHSFLRMTLEGDTLTLEYFNSGWLSEGIKEGRIDIAHQRRDGMIVLVASTQELQELILANPGEAFEDPLEARRLQ